MKNHYDVAIIGGGPGGSTTASMLKKYFPDLTVAIFEREQFPREHVGESQLPPIGQILNEIGCYEKVESAGFPIKIGATYRWGSSNKLWDFEFMPLAQYVDERRPRKYAGQARSLAFQVERAIYDDILLKHSAELGTEVFMPSQVRKVESEGDKVTGFVLDSGERVTADYYVDASGGSGLLRRAMGVGIEVPTKLQNVAFWSYWENSEWAERFGESGTRVLVLSIGAGWIWYIPLGPTRTSIGYICPAEFYRKQGKTPSEIYDWALKQEPLIAELTAKASKEGAVQSTKDWSFIAERIYGENWFLVGESSGFADPILAAGLTLTHTGARELAYTIMALFEGKHDEEWLKSSYAKNQLNRLRQHIRFADFWYSSNGVFTDLQEYTREIAAEAGLDLDAQKAFQWLGTGGFTHDNVGQVGIGGLDLAAARQVAQNFYDENYEWEVSKYSFFKLSLEGAEDSHVPSYDKGEVNRVRCWVRGSEQLPAVGLFGLMVDLVKKGIDAQDLMKQLPVLLNNKYPQENQKFLLNQAMQVLEILVGEKWVVGSTDPGRARINMSSPREGGNIHSNQPINDRLAEM